MAIHQTKKQSDLEKRLQILRRQVYGKEENKKSDDRRSSILSVVEGLTTDSPMVISDLSYLYRDLMKIATFSSLVIGMQVLLFFLLKNNILNINLF